MVGLVLGIIAICCSSVPALAAFTDCTWSWIMLFFYLALITGFVAAVAGRLAWQGKQKDKLGLFGFIFGIFAWIWGFLFATIFYFSNIID